MLVIAAVCLVDGDAITDLIGLAVLVVVVVPQVLAEIKRKREQNAATL